MNHRFKVRLSQFHRLTENPIKSTSPTSPASPTKGGGNQAATPWKPPIFRSSLVPSVALLVSEKCFSGTNLQPSKTSDAVMFFSLLKGCNHGICESVFWYLEESPFTATNKRPSKMLFFCQKKNEQRWRSLLGPG